MRLSIQYNVMYDLWNQVKRYNFVDAGGAHPEVMECSMILYYGFCVQLLADLIFILVTITQPTNRPAKWLLIPLVVFTAIKTLCVVVFPNFILDMFESSKHNAIYYRLTKMCQSIIISLNLFHHVIGVHCI